MENRLADKDWAGEPSRSRQKARGWAILELLTQFTVYLTNYLPKSLFAGNQFKRGKVHKQEFYLEPTWRITWNGVQLKRLALGNLLDSKTA